MGDVARRDCMRREEKLKYVHAFRTKMRDQKKLYFSSEMLSSISKGRRCRGIIGVMIITRT